MRRDIDRLMAAYDLSALIIFGDKAPNAYRDYLTKRAKFGGLVIKKRGEDPIIIASGMEIGEAAKSGLKVQTSYDFGSNELYNLAPYFQKFGITGRVAFYGVADVANVLKRVADLQSAVPGIEIAIDAD